MTYYSIHYTTDTNHEYWRWEKAKNRIIIIIIMMMKMKQITRWVEVKNSQEEITNKHEGKPVIYLEKFSASGHLFFHIFFPWNQLDTSKCISHLWTHYDRLHYEDKGCSNLDSAGINLPLVGLIIIKTQYHHTKENWKTNLSYCVLSKYPHLCSPILISFLRSLGCWMWSESLSWQTLSPFLLGGPTFTETQVSSMRHRFLQSL